MKATIIGVFLLASPVLWAGQVEIVSASLSRGTVDWSASVTLRHNDTGWKHYADAWRIVDENGKQLGKRVLHHPHENEQPFTRSLHNIKISPQSRFVYVEAHDNVHGWSNQRLKIPLDHLLGRGSAAVSKPAKSADTKSKTAKEGGMTKQGKSEKTNSDSK